MLLCFFVTFIKKPSICSADGFCVFYSSLFTPVEGVNKQDDNDDYFKLYAMPAAFT